MIVIGFTPVMFNRTRHVFRNAVMPPAVLIFSALSTQLFAQHGAIVEWYADLSPARNEALGAHASNVQTRATGKVTVEVDFPSKTVTFHVNTKNMAGVDKIELRSYLSSGQLAKPAIFTIYDAREGSFTESLTKTVKGAAFEQVATQILNGVAGILVTTDKNPDGEISGKIVMHKHYRR
jgi:CHRD domain-containing protein